ncbi:cytochrome P450 76A2-like [Mercurialis annua]|uniref:cytochrome P450 76A2-like n=1 Tax=Mercurialis annua TaxID=3986 RepID=UPI00215E646E|nr:cytochrome P450 76A2-like [Mercurialis annua]
MEITSIISLISLILFPTSILLLFNRRRNSAFRSRFPPGPPGWPIIGNLLDLGSMPHRTLTDLKKKYGDILGLKLGSLNTMVILSAKAASELFKNHDLAFAERSLTITMRVHGYDRGSLALAPYGSYWRVMRRLVTVDMLVNKKINETVSIRRKCIDDMLRWIGEESKKGDQVELARFVFLMVTNLIGNLMLSRDLVDPASKEGSVFFKAIHGLMGASGYANIADYLPWLKWFDPQGLERTMERELGKALEIADQFVKERIKEKKLGDIQNKNFLDVLLEFEGNGKDEPERISDKDLNIFILEIFMAGAETTSSTIEWAMTELLRNPIAMQKAKAELNNVIGPDKKVEETDIESLPYLQAVVKETFRLHPPIPFLVPRRAMQDTKFMGFHIPENTQVLVNAWAIGRDEDVWSDPLSFEPERFIGSKVDYRGQHFELIPFGAGRRMCAGVSLAHRVLHLTLGSLLYHFDWEFEANVSSTTLDMRDKLGITMRKLEPLLVVPKKSHLSF